MDKDKEPTDSSLLKQIDTIRCDNFLNFPYYPVITMIQILGETFVAARSRDTIIIYVIVKYACVKTYSLNMDSLPRKSSISAIQFVSPELVKKHQSTEPGPLYLLVGYYSGYLYLIKCVKKQITILKKFNRMSESESGFFSRTMSLLVSGGGSPQYSQWQHTTIVKLKMHDKHPSYLFRNNILVLMSNIQASMDDIQRKFDCMASQSTTLVRNSMNKLDKYFYFICNDFKLIRLNQKCIVAFEGTVSNYEKTDCTLIIGTFTGMVIEFETESFSCLRRINTVIAIKNLMVHENLLVLCLQDDNIQLIDMASNSFVNLAGHHSFASCALSLRKSILVGGFDGCISSTNPAKIKGWKKLVQNANKVPSSFQFANPEIEVGQKSRLESESGIGTALILKDIIVFSMYENTIKMFKVNFQNLSQ